MLHKEYKQEILNKDIGRFVPQINDKVFTVDSASNWDFSLSLLKVKNALKVGDILAVRNVETKDIVLARLFFIELPNVDYSETLGTMRGFDAYHFEVDSRLIKTGNRLTFRSDFSMSISGATGFMKMLKSEYELSIVGNLSTNQIIPSLTENLYCFTGQNSLQLRIGEYESSIRNIISLIRYEKFGHLAVYKEFERSIVGEFPESDKVIINPTIFEFGRFVGPGMSFVVLFDHVRHYNSVVMNNGYNPETNRISIADLRLFPDLRDLIFKLVDLKMGGENYYEFIEAELGHQSLFINQ
ncbi:MAG: hypothetical protein EP332_14565 [Bacteroidetes bacterium]|nr:MAG: hypothetical protein EP332_14565 [Bacteroidota bacterium]